MTANQLTLLLPLLVPGVTVIVLMGSIALRRHHLTTLGLTLAGLAGSIGALLIVRLSESASIVPLLRIDDFSLFFMALLFAAAGAVALLSYAYLKAKSKRPDEYYLLLMLSSLGAATLVATTHFVSFFLGLELLSVSLYALIAYLPDRDHCVEAGFKYLVLAAVSSAFLLFGMALVYARLGSMELNNIAAGLNEQALDLVILAGLAMMVVGIGFKLALVPFHLWTPDVYQGAPAPVTAFLATVSKGAVLALLVRIFVGIDGWSQDWLWLLFGLLAVASMFAGNLLALLQSHLKRLLAYSSIAHLGYVLVALLAGGRPGVDVVAFYLLAYFITILGAFGVVTVLSGGDSEADHLDCYLGLGRRRPVLALILTAMLLSLAGIPLTAGFVGKFLVLAVGVGSKLWALVMLLVINSAIGLYYYLRVVVAMYMTPQTETLDSTEPARAYLALSDGLVLTVLMVLLVWLGVYPRLFFKLVHLASSCLF